MSKFNSVEQFFESKAGKVESTESGVILKEFNGLNEELEALHFGVGLRSIPSDSILELKGEDVLDYLNRISTNELKSLKNKQIKSTLFTNEKGRILDITDVLNLDTSKFLICSNKHKNIVKSWLNRYIITDDVKVLENDTRNSFLEILGNQCESYITYIVGDILLETGFFRAVNIDGFNFFVGKTEDLCGNPKFILFGDTATIVRLADYIISQETPFNIQLIGSEASEYYRIEKGFPGVPNELNDLYNPHELYLNKLINGTKGCYIGQEVIARLETYDKVQKKLVHVRFLESYNNEVQLPAPLFDEASNEIGTLTSVNPELPGKKQLGLALIKKAYLQFGKEFHVKAGNKELLIKIKKIPYTELV